MSDREHLHVSVTICSAFNAIMRLRFGVFCETIRSLHDHIDIVLWL